MLFTPMSCIVSRCSSLDHIKQAHAFMLTRGLDQHNLFLNPLIKACSSLGFPLYAYSVFSRAPRPDSFLFNTLIASLLFPNFSHTNQQQAPRLALSLYNRIQLSGLRPDTYSIPFALKAAAKLSAITTGSQIHSQAICMGLESDIHVVTALVHMYSSSSRHLLHARNLFDSFTLRGISLWNTMLSGYVKCGFMDAARALFDSMPERNVISWTAVISGYARVGRPREAIALFQRMQLDDDVEPDEVAILAVLSACGQLGALEMGRWIHNYVNRCGLQRIVPISNALIDLYAKSGDIDMALEVFEGMKSRTIVTWTTMIAGLALHGLGKEALDLFSRMEREGVKPNAITFIAVLSACSHVGLVDVGQQIFNGMRLRHGIEPSIEHYGCMIDLLGRAGHLKEAEDLLWRMPFRANAATWGSLLAACNTFKDAKIGERALQHLMKLEPHNSGNYALLCNIYASLGRWNESRIVRKMMRDVGVKKMLGGSSIVVNNRVHEFIAGEIFHPQFERVCQLTHNMNWQLKSIEDLHEQWD